MISRDAILLVSSILDRGAIRPESLDRCLEVAGESEAPTRVVLGRLAAEGLLAAGAGLPDGVPSATAVGLVEAALRRRDPGAALPDTRGDCLSPGSRLGPFRVERALGWGGMGTVYLAENLEAGRTVALKVLGASALGRPQVVARFLQESRLAARVRHPRVVALLGAGEADGVHYIEMEYVEGASLDKVLETGQPSVSEAVRIALQAAEGLAAAHQAGVVHRDVKPANILVAADGSVKVGDFGLARALDAEGAALTRPGQVLGSPYYMSPEQVRGARVDGRADVYSLGATLYRSLTRRFPFEGDHVTEILRKHREAEPISPRVRNAAVPEALCTVLRRMMAKEPEARYATMQQVQAVLAPFARGTAAAVPAAAAGSEVGRYRLEGLLGEGGMGQVWLARPREGGAPVALKLVRESAGDEAARRFEREARAALAIQHPNVVAVLDVCLDGRPPHIAMEYVEGRSLRQRLEEGGALSGAEALPLLRQALEGLEAAHQRRIVHRDIKPENLLVTGSGRLKVADFGLAKLLEEREALTRTGTGLGTPYYMAPEQCKGDPVDPRTDLYALGATFYHLLVGAPPFDADTQLAVLLQHMETPPEPLARRAPGVPEALAALVGNLLAKRPGRRYPSARSVLADLDRLEAGGAVRARPGGLLPYGRRRHPAWLGWALGGAGAAATAAVAALLGWMGPVSLSLQDPVGVQGGRVPVRFAASREGAVAAWWSVDAGAEFRPATAAAVGPGLFEWDAAADLAALDPRRRFPEVRLRLAPGRGEAVTTAAFPVDLSEPPRVLLLEGPVGAAWDGVRLRLRVEDAEGDPVRLEARYALAGQQGFPEAQRCTLAGADAEPPAGVGVREVVWESGRDLPSGDREGVRVAVWAADEVLRRRVAETPAVAGPFTLLNTAPRVEAVGVAGTASDRVPVDLVLTDAGGQDSTVDLAWSLDGGAWSRASLAETPAGPLGSSPQGTHHRLVWDAHADLGSVRALRCRLRLSPREAATGRPGEPAVTPPFQVDNRFMTSVAGGSVGEGVPALEAALGVPTALALGPAGDLYVVDSVRQRVRVVNTRDEPLVAFGVRVPPGAVSTVAGSGGSGVSAEMDSALRVQLVWPSAATLDAQGNLYVADLGGRRVYKVWRDIGVMERVAGNGGGGPPRDGASATEVGIGAPAGLAVDDQGRLWVATAEGELLSLDAEGRVRVRHGGGEWPRERLAATRRGLTSMNWSLLDLHPTLAAGPGETLLVADPVAGVVRAIGLGGATVGLWGREVPPDTAVVVAGGGAEAPADGLEATRSRLVPQGIAVGADGLLYVADAAGHRVHRVEASGRLRRTAGSGVPGSGGDGGPATLAGLAHPAALAVSPDGLVYVAERDGARVRVVNRAPDMRRSLGRDLSPGAIDTLAGTGAWSGAPEGAPSSLEVTLPEELALGGAGELYVAEAWRVRRVDPAARRAGPVLGDGEPPSPRTAPPEEEAALEARTAPTSLASLAGGLLLVTDCSSAQGRARLRAVNTGDRPVDLAGGPLAPGRVRTLYTLEPLPCAVPAVNLRVASAPGGEVYLTVLRRSSWDPAREPVAEPCTELLLLNPWPRPLRAHGLEVSAGATVRVAGGERGGRVVDGTPCLEARIGHVTALHAVEGGLVLVGEGDGAQVVVATRLRAFNLGEAPGACGGRAVPPGRSARIAGTGEDRWSGDGYPALESGLTGVRGIASGADGTVYFSDFSYERVRWVAQDGLLVTVAGVPMPLHSKEVKVNGYKGDGGPATDAWLNGPSGLVRDAEGNLYLADLFNHRVRRFHP